MKDNMFASKILFSLQAINAEMKVTVTWVEDQALDESVSVQGKLSFESPRWVVGDFMFDADKIQSFEITEPQYRRELGEVIIRLAV